MKQPTKRAQLLTAVVVVAAAVLVVGPGYENSHVRMRPGTIWLTSAATGEATLVDGATAEVAARVRVGEPGAALSVVQHSGDALVLDQGTGALRRIDTATLDVTEPSAVLPENSVLRSGQDAVYAVHSGMITPVESGAGRPVLLADSLSPDNVVVDGDRLWTIDEETGDLVRLAGEERRTWPAAAKAGRLAITANRPALVDPERGTAELLSRDTGSVTRSARTGLRAGDTIAVSGSADRARVLIANSTRGDLVVCEFDTGSCADPVHVSDPGADLGAPIEADNHAVVPDHSTGQATIVDLARSRVVAQRRLFDQPTRFELLTRDGIVFFNDPGGNIAGVLNLAGEVQTVTKYTGGDVPSTPEPQAQPNLATQVDHSKRKPGMGVTTVQPSTPAPGRTTSIVVRPGSRGVVGDEFELTVVAPSAPGPATARWQFGDGTEATGGTVRHTWHQAGTFQVRAVTLGEGNRTEAATTVVVDPPKAPPRITALNVRRPKPVIGEPVRFSADTTAPPDGWAWTVTRPGKSAPEVTARTAEFTHAFTTPGSYTVTLTISAGKQTSQSSRQFTVVRGTVKGWGLDFDGAATPPPSAASGVIAIDAGDAHALALKADGSVIGWGQRQYGAAAVPEEASSGVVAIAAGSLHSLALKADGSVIAWGSDALGQASVPPAASRDVVAIAAGALHSLALKADGSVVGWGFNRVGQTDTPPAAMSGVIAIDAGVWTSMALKADGSVVIWGQESCPGEPPVTAPSAIAAGNDTCLAVENGSVVGWGEAANGEASPPPAAQSDVVTIDIHQRHVLALKADGSVVGWGTDDWSEASVPPEYSTGAMAVAAGSAFSLVLLENW